LQRGLKIGEVGQIDELVEGGGEERGIGLHGVIIPALDADEWWLNPLVGTLAL
jgi:hypothetical protein